MIKKIICLAIAAVFLLAGQGMAQIYKIPENYQPEYFGNGVFFFDMDWYEEILSGGLLGGTERIHYDLSPQSMAAAISVFRGKLGLNDTGEMIVLPYGQDMRYIEGFLVLTDY